MIEPASPLGIEPALYPLNLPYPLFAPFNPFSTLLTLSPPNLPYPLLSYLNPLLTPSSSRGIERANEELQTETDARFYEKGIMRQIPLFGPVLNWMSPIEDKRIVGRSFSLHSGGF